MEFRIYTVSQLTAEVKSLIEGTFPPVWVEGEIYSFVHHASGHMYFSLKDEAATLRCVFFRQNNIRLAFRPENGMKALAFGELSVYEPSGQYQLKVGTLRPAGIGELQLAFEQLKAKLLAEGFFDPEHKRPIPSFPAVVGVVTSPTGAAIRDIISVIARRCPPVRIVLFPVKVQGEGSAREIAAGIRALGRWGQADVIIVGRGGGSAEDLWAFNEEVVARAIFESPVPVISAVGHETDFTIADFVADLRAPTPSAAAEFAVPDAAELIAGLRSLTGRLVRSGRERTEAAWQGLDSLERSLSPRRLQSRLNYGRERAGSLARLLAVYTKTRLEGGIARWEGLRQQLVALDPTAVLQRGFALARDRRGEIIRDARSVQAGERIELTLSRGALDCLVEAARPEAPAPAVPVPPVSLKARGNRIALRREK